MLTPNGLKRTYFISRTLELSFTSWQRWLYNGYLKLQQYLIHVSNHPEKDKQWNFRTVRVAKVISATGKYSFQESKYCFTNIWVFKLNSQRVVLLLQGFELSLHKMMNWWNVELYKCGAFFSCPRQPSTTISSHLKIKGMHYMTT